MTQYVGLMNLELGGLVEDWEKVTQPVYGPQNYVEWFRHVNRKYVKHTGSTPMNLKIAKFRCVVRM